MKKTATLLLLLTVCATCAIAAPASDSTKVSKELTAYQKLFDGKKSVEHKSGIMTIHRADDVLYLEMPVSLFGRDFLTSSTLEGTSDLSILSPGLSAAKSRLIKLDRTDSLVLFRLPKYSAISGEGNTQEALRQSQIGAVIKTFPILAYSADSSAVVFDVTSYFKGDNEYVADFKGSKDREGTFIFEQNVVSDQYCLKDIDACEGSVSVSFEAGYKFSLAGFNGAELSKKLEAAVSIVASLILMKEDKMPTREADFRIGTGKVTYTSFTDKGSREGHYATRRDLLSLDVPVVFYVDTLFTPSWAEAITKGLLSWNPALDSAGIKDAIRVEPYPTDADFHASNPLINKVVFSAQTGMAITSTSLLDVRTGEILSTQITVPRDFVQYVRRNSVYSISLADARYREYFLADDAVCEVLSAIVMQKMASALGLSANMAGSAAYTTEQLRDPAFTQRYGFTASVTDDVLFNYAARPGDRERGVQTIISKPGVYDEYAIRWLYGPDDSEALNSWIVSHQDDERYFYGKPNTNNLYRDPRCLSVDLGSDVVETIAQNLETLRFVAENGASWLQDDRIPQDYKVFFPEFLFLRLFDFANILPKYIGGIYQWEPHEGSDKVMTAVPKEVQREMMLSLLDLFSDLTWLDEPSFKLLNGPVSDISTFAITNMPFRNIIFALKSIGLCVQLSDDPYTVDEIIKDLTDYVFRDVRSSGRPLSRQHISYAGSLISYLVQSSPVMTGTRKRALASGTAMADPLFDNEAVEVRGNAYYYYPYVDESVYIEALKVVRKDMLKAISAERDPDTKTELRYYLSIIDSAL